MDRDWRSIRDQVNLGRVATALLGPPLGRNGQGQGQTSASRLWWRCPLHDDKNPSFLVERGKPWWKCFGCGARGDAPGLIMKLKAVRFPEAVRIAAELSGLAEPAPAPHPSLRDTFSRGEKGCGPSGACSPSPSGRRWPERPDEGTSTAIPPIASGVLSASALGMVDDSARRLWMLEGAGALAYLHGRGLKDETIRAARLGYAPGVSIPTRDGDRCYRASGVVIPWFDGDRDGAGERLALVKIRQAEGRRPKYVEVFRDRPGLFPSAMVIQSGRPLVIVEGEFDALLLGQALAGLTVVVTLGSASNSVRPGPALLAALLAASPWYLATDADPAGDLAEGGLARAHPPCPPPRAVERLDRSIPGRPGPAGVVGGILVERMVGPVGHV